VRGAARKGGSYRDSPSASNPLHRTCLTGNHSVNRGNLYESVVGSHAPPWRGNPGKRASLAHTSRLPRRSRAGAVVAPRKDRKGQPPLTTEWLPLDCCSHATALAQHVRKAQASIFAERKAQASIFAEASTGQVACAVQMKTVSHSDLFLVPPPTTEWLPSLMIAC